MPANPATVEHRRAAAEVALERELRRIVDSGEYGEWFRRMSLFHRYAPTNSLWIMAQLADRPDASGIVASYRTWQRLGRQVRKGERGIMDRGAGRQARRRCRSGGDPRRPTRRLRCPRSCG